MKVIFKRIKSKEPLDCHGCVFFHNGECGANKLTDPATMQFPCEVDRVSYIWVIDEKGDQ